MVEKLGCTADVTNLMRYLEELDGDDLPNSHTIVSAVKRLFHSEQAELARKQLTELSDKEATLEDQVRGERNYRQDWALAAGLSCPPAEFQDFRDVLNSEAVSQQALFGYAIRLTTTQPLEATGLLLKQLEKDIHSYRKNEILAAQMEHLPPSTDFEKLETMLQPPKDQPSILETYNDGRRILMNRWGSQHSEQAFEYTMKNQDRVSPEAASSMFTGIIHSDPQYFKNIIETMPPGAYRDQAYLQKSYHARGGPPDYYDNLPATLEALKAIDDRELRKQSLEGVEGFLSTMEKSLSEEQKKNVLQETQPHTPADQ
jgi:hypothetical protein